MGFPEPGNDEPVILDSRIVTCNSISYNAILTNKRIHLTANKKNVIPSKDITLTTIRTVEAGENAIRDHFLILSLVTEAGEKHQEVLTFARLAGVERKRECNEWVKKINSLILLSTPVIAASDSREREKEPLAKREGPTPIQGTATSTPPVKKKIPIVRPIETIIEKSPGAPEPGETTSIPSGSFCSRCGNRIPQKSTFCSHCGTPVKRSEGPGQEPQPGVSEAQVSVPSRSPQPAVRKGPEKVQPPVPKPAVPKGPEKVQPPVPQPVVPKGPEKVQPPVPQPVVPKGPEKVQPPVPQPVVPKGPEKVQPPVPQPVVPEEPEKVQHPVPQPAVPEEPVTVQPPAGFPSEGQEDSIGQVTHSIEPLITESVPGARHHPARVQKHTSRYESEPSSDASSAGSRPHVVWPVFFPTEFPAVPAREPDPAEPESPPSPLIPAPGGKKTSNLVIGILFIAILPMVVGLIIGATLMSGPSGGPANATPVIPLATTIHTQLPQATSTPLGSGTLEPGSTQGLIPTTGVWVRVSYPGTYSGLISTPWYQLEVTDTGDHFYPIPTNERTVTANLEKKDGTGDQIILEVYKNGVMLKRESNITPNGIVEIQLDLTTL